jgi:hypothetical protein
MAGICGLVFAVIEVLDGIVEDDWLPARHFDNQLVVVIGG